MHKYRLFITAIFLAFLVGCNISSAESNTEKSFFAMDTAVIFKGSSADAEKAAEIFNQLDGLFDRYSTDSEVYAINNREEIDVSEYTSGIIKAASELSEQYGSDVNIFAGELTDCWNITSVNPKVPSDDEIEAALESLQNSSFSLDTMSFSNESGSIDLGSVGKGYALDRVHEELDKDSLYILSASSSVLLNGTKNDGEKFTVSIRNPEASDKILGVIKTDACFLSSSGGYERFFEVDGEKYSHIFDLSTGRPSETDLTSVTVMCDSGIESDFLSTLIYLSGTERLGEYLSNENFKVVAVTENKEIYMSDGIEFELFADSEYKVKELETDE